MTTFRKRLGFAALILPVGFGALLLFGPDGCSGYSPDISFSVSPDGHSIVFAGAGKGGQGIYTLNFETMHAACVQDTPDIEGDPAFMPDGRHVVYSSSSSARDAPFHLFVASLDGRSHRQITFGDSTSDVRPTVSPDGERVVFVRSHHYERVRGFGGSPWTQWTLETVRSDGSGEMTLSDFNASGISPHFASNRWQIVFAGSSPVTSADPAAPEVNVLYTIDAVAGGAPRQITKEGYLADPSFSPDSKDIVCVSDPTRRFEYDIAVMHLATRRIQQLNVTRETHLCRSPVFTPDGKHILFLGDVNPAGGKHSGLYEVDRTGANLRRIAGSDLFYDPTGWRP